MQTDVTVLDMLLNADNMAENAIIVNGQRLLVVDKSIFLGSALYRAVNIDTELSVRAAKASFEFGRLIGNVWKRNRIRLDIN